MHEFDRKIRVLIFSAIEEVGLHLRTQLSYYHANNYGALGYLNSENYNKYHKGVIANLISDAIKKLARECVNLAKSVVGTGIEFESALVGELAPPINSELSKIQSFKERGR